MQSCDVSVIVGVDAELDERSVNDVEQTEDVIVSQWREISADERHQMREQFDEILRPLGLQTRLVVGERANSLALFLLCMTLSALIICGITVELDDSETLSSHSLLSSLLVESGSRD